MALRNRDTSKPIMVDGVDVMPEVRAVLEQMKECSEKIRSVRGTVRCWLLRIT